MNAYFQDVCSSLYLNTGNLHILQHYYIGKKEMGYYLNMERSVATEKTNQGKSISNYMGKNNTNIKFIKTRLLGLFCLLLCFCFYLFIYFIHFYIIGVDEFRIIVFCIV